MAAILHVDPSFIAPPGMELIDTGYAATDINVGDPVIITGTAPNRMHTNTVTKATGTEFHGICVKSTKTRGMCEYACVGEMDGFTGLTPGASVTVVGGVLDDTPAAVGEQVKVRAVNAGRIRFNLV